MNEIISRERRQLSHTREAFLHAPLLHYHSYLLYVTHTRRMRKKEAKNKGKNILFSNEHLIDMARL